MSTYVHLPDEVLFNSSSLAVEIEEELSERFISGDITESEYHELKSSVDDWLKSTRRAIGIYRSIYHGVRSTRYSKWKVYAGI